MKTVDIARFIRHIGARDFVRASSMLEDIIKKETNVMICTQNIGHIN